MSQYLGCVSLIAMTAALELHELKLMIMFSSILCFNGRRKSDHLQNHMTTDIHLHTKMNILSVHHFWPLLHLVSCTEIKD